MMQPEDGNPPADVESGGGAGGGDTAPHILKTVGGFPVTLFNDEHFAKCRTMLGVDSDILDEFEFAALASGGGKGGEAMAFTADRKYIVKQVAGNDHDALLNHVEVLCTRMAANDTLMSKMLWHFEIAEGAHAGTYFVMNNCLPTLPEPFKWARMYDLKGCCDDKVITEDGERVEEVHKRCFSCDKCWYGCDLACCCCNTPERMRYFQGKRFALSVKFPVDKATKEYLDRVIGADCDFFTNTMVTMDYSLILGTVVCKKGEEGQLPPGVFPNQPFLAYTDEDEVTAYYFGIIDFLQEWTTAKKIAACIKCCFAPKPISTIPPAQYAAQFTEYFQEKFVATDGASVPLSATRAAVGEETTTSPPAGVEMVSLSEEASASEQDAYNLGAQVAEVEAKDAEEKQAAEDQQDEHVTDSQREAFAAGHAVASEAFPELPASGDEQDNGTS